MTAPLYQPAGTHLIADLHGVDAAKIIAPHTVEALLVESARAAGAHVLSSHFHFFGEGKGVTGVVLLAESHITIHTWPECRFAAVDIFMCGHAEPQCALDLLQAALQPESVTTQSVARGYRFGKEAVLSGIPAHADAQ